MNAIAIGKRRYAVGLEWLDVTNSEQERLRAGQAKYELDGRSYVGSCNESNCHGMVPLALVLALSSEPEESSIFLWKIKTSKNENPRHWMCVINQEGIASDRIFNRVDDLIGDLEIVLQASSEIVQIYANFQVNGYKDKIIQLNDDGLRHRLSLRDRGGALVTLLHYRIKKAFSVKKLVATTCSVAAIIAATFFWSQNRISPVALPTVEDVAPSPVMSKIFEPIVAKNKDVYAIDQLKRLFNLSIYIGEHRVKRIKCDDGRCFISYGEVDQIDVSEVKENDCTYGESGTLCLVQLRSEKTLKRKSNREMLKDMTSKVLGGYEIKVASKHVFEVMSGWFFDQLDWDVAAGEITIQGPLDV